MRSLPSPQGAYRLIWQLLLQGITIFIGEIIGASLMPSLLGYLSGVHGLKVIFLFAAVTPLIAGFVAFFYKETAPIKLVGKTISFHLVNTGANNRG